MLSATQLAPCRHVAQVGEKRTSRRVEPRSRLNCSRTGSMPSTSTISAVALERAEPPPPQPATASAAATSNSALRDARSRPLHLRRVGAGAGGAVHLRAVVVGALPGLDVLRLPAPRLQRRRLQGAPVRERQLPRV